MKSFVSLGLVTSLVGAAVLAVPAYAQKAPADTAPIFAPKADEKSSSTPAAPRRRAISPEAAAALAAVTPKYSPPPATPASAPKADGEEVDMRDIDKPKNTIVRLPKVIVIEKKPAILSERAITTDKGLADIAVRRYISEMDRAMNRFPIPFIGASMEARALAMYAEDERLKNMSDLRENAVDAAKADPAAGAYILRETNQTYLRSSDFGWRSGMNSK